MKTVETITTAKDILALVDFICSRETKREYKLCNEQEIRLEYSFPTEAPRWIVPVTISGKEEIKYFIFDHEYCSLSLQKEYEGLVSVGGCKINEVDAWGASHHWLIEDGVVKTVFTISDSDEAETTNIPGYWVYRCYFEHQPSCSVLFLTPDDVMNAFPFRDIVKNVKSIELKVTSYNEPVWLLTQNNGRQYVIYPCALHRFCDKLNVTHYFDGELRNPQKDEKFLVYHSVGGEVVCSLIALKVKDEQELTLLRFSEMNTKTK